MKTTRCTNQKRAVKQAKATHCWTSAFIQGQKHLMTKDLKTVFPERLILITQGTPSLILTWIWMTAQIMNHANDVSKIPCTILCQKHQYFLGLRQTDSGFKEPLFGWEETVTRNAIFICSLDHFIFFPW